MATPNAGKRKRRFSLATLLLIVTAAALLVRFAMLLDPRVRLVGEVVVLGSAEHISGVRVFAHSEYADKTMSTTTDAHGRYRFPPTERSPYVVWIQSDEWAARPVKIEFADGVTEVPAIQLSPGAKITLHIIDQDGKPVSAFPNEVVVDYRDRVARLRQPNRVSSAARSTYSVREDRTFQFRLPEGESIVEFGHGHSHGVIGREGESLSVYLVEQPNGSLARYYEDPSSGHFYAAMQNRFYSWEQAAKNATKHKFMGMPGHLVTITSAREQKVVSRLFEGPLLNQLWAGATDEDQDGVWKWVCGPEAGDVFYRVGEKLDRYHNWNRTHQIEPNNKRGAEHCMLLSASGRLEDSFDNAIMAAYRFESVDLKSNFDATWQDDNGQTKRSGAIVEFSKPKTKLAPDAEPAALHDSSTNSQDVDFVYAVWNDTWRVHGHTLSDSKWFLWESPPSTLTGSARYAHSGRKVAMLSAQHEGEDVPPRGWLLDMSTNRWHEIPPLPHDEAFTMHFFDFVGDNVVVLGESHVGNGYVGVFNTKTQQWRVNTKPLRPLGEKRSYAKLGNRIIMNGEHWLVGGSQSFKPNLRNFAYDVAKDEWLQLEEPPFPCVPVAEWNGSLIMRSRAGDALRLALHSPSQSTWTEIQSLPAWIVAEQESAESIDDLFSYSGRAPSFRIVIAKDQLFLIGQLGMCAVYDFHSSQWREIEPSPPAGHNMNITTVSDTEVILYRGREPNTGLVRQDAAVINLQTGKRRTLLLPTRPSNTIGLVQ